MAILTVQPDTTHRDWDDVIKFPGRFAGFTYEAVDQEPTWDLTHRIEWAIPAAAAGGGNMLDPLHRYIAVKNYGVDPVLLHLNTQANGPNEAFEVTVLPGHWVEYADLWMTVQPSIRVDSALYSSPMECEVLQIGEHKEEEIIPEDFCDMWAVGHTIQDGVMTKHHPEIPGPWATIPTPAGPLAVSDHWFTDVAGVDEDEYWAVGYDFDEPPNGLFGFWNGTTWAEVAVVDDPPMYGVWGFDTDDYWAVGGAAGGPGEIWHWDSPWAFNDYPNGDQDERILFCVHGDIPAQVTVAGEYGLIAQYNGVAWGVVSGSGDPEFEEYNFYGTWTALSQTSYVCGGTAPWLAAPGGVGAIYRQQAPFVALWDPMVVTTIQHPTCPTLRAMWGFSDTDIWAVGDEQTILHWTGGPFWERIAPPAGLEGETYHFRGVFGCWPWAVWAIGTNEITADNVIIYWDGINWQTIDHGPNLAEGDLLGLKGVWVGGVPV